MATILLLEPDVTLGGVYVEYLQESGHKVIHCKEAGEAITNLDSAKFDLVILEVQIARHNGIEFLYEMRSYPDWQNIPVIINSMIPNRSIQNNKQVLLQLNISEILYKPLTSLHNLARAVNKNVPTRILS